MEFEKIHITSKAAVPYRLVSVAFAIQYVPQMSNGIDMRILD